MHETPNQEPRPRPPLVLAGRYLLVRAEDTTETSATLTGWDSRLKRWGTIQVARPGDPVAAHRMLALARRAAKLEHAALERVVDVGTDGDVSFVVRDRLVGSAADHIKRNGAISALWAVRVVARLADGLAWAHAKNVIHSHINPALVRWAADGSAVLTGFGQSGPPDTSAEARNGAPWAHLGPELRQRWRPTVATEVYALGALLYTLVVGRHSADLFYGETYEDLLNPLPRVLRPVVVRACSLEPNERYTSAAELQDALLSRLTRLNQDDAPAAPPWLDNTHSLPDTPPPTVAYDAVMADIAEALGVRSPEGEAERIDDTTSGGTLDPETGRPAPYTMPHIRTKDPGFRDPFDNHQGGDLPAYVDRTQPGLITRGVERVVVHERGRAHDSPTPVSRPDRRIQQVKATAVAALLAALLALLVLGGGGLVAWHLGTAGLRSDRAFIEAVSDEGTTIGAFAAGNKELEAAWFRFVDAPGDRKARAADELVGQLTTRAEAAPVPVSTERAIGRLNRARDAWRERQ